MPNYSLNRIRELGWLPPEDAEKLRQEYAEMKALLEALEARLDAFEAATNQKIAALQVSSHEVDGMVSRVEAMVREIEARLAAAAGPEQKQSLH